MLYDRLIKKDTYTDSITPLLAEAIILAVLVNLASKYIGGWLRVDGGVLSVTLFSLLAMTALSVLYRRQRRNLSIEDRQKPAEFGSVLSLVFFAQFLFWDAARMAEFNKWILLGVGALPFLAGVGFTEMLDQVLRQKRRTEELMRHFDQAQRAAAQANHADAFEAPRGENARSEAELIQRARISLRAVIQGKLDLERQPAIFFIIIESILSAQKSVSQMEIFAVCRVLSKEPLSSNFSGLIYESMAKFVTLHQDARNVMLLTDGGSGWTIVETPAPADIPG